MLINGTSAQYFALFLLIIIAIFGIFSFFRGIAKLSVRGHEKPTGSFLLLGFSIVAFIVIALKFDVFNMSK